MKKIEPIGKDTIQKLLDLIGDAEIMDGHPIEPDKVTNICIRDNSVALYDEINFKGVSYYTDAPWRFLVEKLNSVNEQK